ncbi:MAG: hypothetical protein EA409_03400 [Saprospirales bacterium]|nr:MAG: hypothetical protein EA409_03400 [Saprospirales bacterium]
MAITESTLNTILTMKMSEKFKIEEEREETVSPFLTIGKRRPFFIGVIGGFGYRTMNIFDICIVGVYFLE